MAILINVIESAKQVVFEIPEYITIRVDQPSTVFYTFDGTQPDPSGSSPTTFILETDLHNALVGTIFLPTNTGLVSLNVLAVGIPDTNIGQFYRRYGLEHRDLGSDKHPISTGSTILNSPSPLITADGVLISPDAYTIGTTTEVDITQVGRDGYEFEYKIAHSGQQVVIPQEEFDHITGYGEDGKVISTTILTPEEEIKYRKNSERGDIFVDGGSGIVSRPTLQNIDPRSSGVKDSKGRQIEVVPIEDYPAGYFADGNNVNDDFDNAPDQKTSPFSSSGIFNPRAAYIEIDGRIDGYINGQPILPGDRKVIMGTFSEIRYKETKEDLGDAKRVSPGYISGGLATVIYDYERGQAAFYYHDSRDNRWILSLQKITPPKFELVARRNGVVVGQVFKWVMNRRQVLGA